MEITDNIIEHDVIDYNFTFVSGLKLALTADLDLGDDVTEQSDHFEIYVAPRPTLSDEISVTNAEEMRVYKTHLAAVTWCARKQKQRTTEDQFDTKKFIHEMA